jgi:hypothetical protein
MDFEGNRTRLARIQDVAWGGKREKRRIRGQSWGFLCFLILTLAATARPCTDLFSVSRQARLGSSMQPRSAPPRILRAKTEQHTTSQPPTAATAAPAPIIDHSRRQHTKFLSHRILSPTLIPQELLRCSAFRDAPWQYWSYIIFEVRTYLKSKYKLHDLITSIEEIQELMRRMRHKNAFCCQDSTIS